ncbi:unnamed protein product [Rotaria sp. Silwood1]|nr:unnamed protein product [Rotaria sp. Silwood1]CAF1625354.1 unnamed protein product [Rotaria sp. Silwood1]
MRSAQNGTTQNTNSNEKPKLENQIIKINNNNLEDLANEILYEILDYLDTYDVYKAFCHLNQRFKNLLLSSNVPKKINISIMSRSKFEDYSINILLSNRQRIQLLRLTNPFIVDAIFSPPNIISEFIRLETLILENIQSNHLDDIFYCLKSLPNFHSLIFQLAYPIDYLTDIFSNILPLPKLKYCKITYYDIRIRKAPLYIDLTEFDRSPIEHLIINGYFPFELLNYLLCCLPRLCHLSINCLHINDNRDMEIQLPLIELKYLEYVSLKLNGTTPFNQFENLAKRFFRHVKSLRLTTYFEKAYLNAQRWESLILSYMPNLHIFDITHRDFAQIDLSCHDVMHQFNSSFWIEREWFFTHQHVWGSSEKDRIFYSTNPYQRQDHLLCVECDNRNFQNIKEININSVTHLSIYNEEAIYNSINYFPNVIQLSIDYPFKTSNYSISTTLNRLLPLKQLTRLNFGHYIFPFEEIVKLLCFTRNLSVLQFEFSLRNETDIKSIQESETFQFVSKTNKIKILNILNEYSFKQLELVAGLLPRVEYLKTHIGTRELKQMIRFLLTKCHGQLQDLFFLNISDMQIACIQDIYNLIKCENLLDHYFIDYVEDDLYIWW